MESGFDVELPVLPDGMALGITVNYNDNPVATTVFKVDSINPMD